MSVTLLKDNLLDGSKATKDRDGWKTFTRSLILQCTTETSNQGIYDLIDEWLTDHDISTADGGTAHPNIANCYAVALDFNILGPTQVKVTIAYERREDDEEMTDVPADITVGTVLEQQTANTDYQGRVLSVRYIDTPEVGPPFNRDQTGSASVFLPKTSLTFTRIEASHPGAKSLEFVGKTNSRGWKGIESNCPARVWLCTSINGNSTNGGASYNVAYEFARSGKAGVNADKEVTWDAFVYYTDPATGKPPEDVNDIDYDVAVGGGGVAGKNGWQRCQMYPTIDFNKLRLRADG